MTEHNPQTLKDIILQEKGIVGRKFKTNKGNRYTLLSNHLVIYHHNGIDSPYIQVKFKGEDKTTELNLLKHISDKYLYY